MLSRHEIINFLEKVLITQENSMTPPWANMELHQTRLQTRLCNVVDVWYLNNKPKIPLYMCIMRNGSTYAFTYNELQANSNTRRIIIEGAMKERDRIARARFEWEQKMKAEGKKLPWL